MSPIEHDSVRQDLVQNQLLARNTVLNLVGQGIPILVAFGAIPLLIKHLGSERFAVLTIAWMVIGYFNLFDLGLSRALTKKVAELLGKNDAQIPQLVWATLLFTFLLGLLGATALYLLSDWLVHDALKISPHLELETLQAMHWITLSLPFVITMSALRGLLEAQQKFTLINAIQIPLGIYSYLGPLVVALYNPTLPAVLFVLMIGRVATWFCFLFLAGWTLPTLFKRFALNFNVLKELIQFGGWLTVSNTMAPILAYADRFVIGSLISIEAVAHYATPYEIIMKMWIIPGAVISVIFPAFAASYRAQEYRTSVIFSQAIKFLILAVFPLSFLMTCFAKEGLSIWINPDFAITSAPILQILGVAILINIVAFVPSAFLQAIGRPDVPAKLHVFECVVYLPILFYLTKNFGLPGAAVAWLFRTTLDLSTLLYFANRIYTGLRYRWQPVLLVGLFLISTLIAPIFMTALNDRIIFFLVCLALFFFLTFREFLDSHETAFLKSRLLALMSQKEKPDATNQPFARPIRSVGIAMAVYSPNPEFFRQQLESITNQSFKNWKCVLTLDSPLEALKKIEILAPYLNDPRFTWIENPTRLGFKKNFENAVRQTLNLDVDALALSDQDDIWYENKLQMLVDFLSDKPPMSLVHSDMHVWFDDEVPDLKKMRTGWQIERKTVIDNTLSYFLVHNIVAGASCLFDREVAQHFLNIPDHIDFHDHWYACAAVVSGGVFFVDSPLYAYRQHGRNVVGITPYEGLFYAPSGVHLSMVVRKALHRWQQTRLLAEELVNHGRKLTPIQSFVFLKNYDLGLSLAFWGGLHIFTNPAYARACLFKAFGKFVEPLFALKIYK